MVLPLWIRGTLLALGGSTLTALGLVVQKQSHAGDAADAEADRSKARPYWTQPWWVFGFSLFLGAQILNLVSMALTPQTILSCLGSWTLVCNTMFARLLLNEFVSRGQVVAMTGLVAATVLVIGTAPRPHVAADHVQTTSVDFVVSRFTCWEFDLLTAVMLMCCCTTWALGERASRTPGISSLQGSKVDPSDGDGDEEDDAPMTTQFSMKSFNEVGAKEAAQLAMIPLSRAMVAAITSGFTALLFKCIAELTASVGAENDPWTCWQTFVILGAGLSCAPAELHFLNMALQTGEAIFVVPVYLALAMVSQLLTGMVFFQEYLNFVDSKNAAQFAGSVGVLLTFVVMMSKAQAEASDDDDEDLDDLEESLLEPKLPGQDRVKKSVVVSDMVEEMSPTATDRSDEVPAEEQQDQKRVRFMTAPALAIRPARTEPRTRAGTVAVRSTRSMSSLDDDFDEDVIQVTVAGFSGAIACMEAVSKSSRRSRLGTRSLGRSSVASTGKFRISQLLG